MTAAGRTGPRFAQAFRRAGAAGLRRTVHAGESSGPEGVRDAIELLGSQLDRRELCRCRRQGEAGRGVGALVMAVTARLSW